MKLLRSLSTLQIALGISLAVHAALLTVRLVDPEAFQRVFEDTALEVILVNANAREHSDNPTAIAQAALAGGGDADQGRATSFLPPTPYDNPGDTEQDAAARAIQAMQEQQNLLLSELKAQLATMPETPPQQRNERSDLDEQKEQRKKMLKLIAEIERRIQVENSRPKKRYISPATKEAAYAVYYDTVRSAIEERGTANFPQSGGKKLYGALFMTITINHDGRVLEADVVESSGNPTLDRRARSIARSAGPFESFTAGMRRKADQLVIVSRFNFTRDQTLETQLFDKP